MQTGDEQQFIEALKAAMEVTGAPASATTR